MRVLVTGGAGYIGSQMVRQLIEKKNEIVVVDTLEHGHRAAIAPGVPLEVGDIGDEKFLRGIFSRYKFDAVINFAGYIEVPESVANPAKYYTNNVSSTVTLLNVMVQAGVKQFVFSSSAGVYGNATQIPIPESLRPEPINPYGESKWMVERILTRFDTAFGLRSFSLRYFNAAGAALDGNSGEDHPHEIHIIPLAIRAAQTNQPFNIYGDNYSTPDHTCVRDYVHIVDLGDAHLLALDALMNGHATGIYNIGTGRGYSNREIAETVRRVTGIDMKIQLAPRRPGDPDALVADSSRLKQDLGWKPRHSDLETIVGSAWKWHQNHPNGYGDK
jgi:UDP-glucose 4-epimerase